MSRRMLALVVLVPFTLYSIGVALRAGPIGFVELAWREPWAGQMLIDLLIALALVFGSLAADARRRGVALWPFVVLTLALGSIGPLTYHAIHGDRDRGA